MTAVILISSLKVQMLSLLLFATFVTPFDKKALVVLNVRKVEKVVVVAAVEEKVFRQRQWWFKRKRLWSKRLWQWPWWWK